MGQTKLGEKIVNTAGDLPAVGNMAPDFVLVGNDLREVNSKNFTGKRIVLNIFPSIDTSTCAASVKEFNKRASSLNNTIVFCIAKDLPFAMRRFCGTEGIDKVVTLSDFRDLGFSKSYGVVMIDGGMSGFFARAVVVIGEDGKVRYTELVPVVGQEPNYDAALKAI